MERMRCWFIPMRPVTPFMTMPSRFSPMAFLLPLCNRLVTWSAAWVSTQATHPEQGKWPAGAKRVGANGQSESAREAESARANGTRVRPLCRRKRMQTSVREHALALGTRKYRSNSPEKRCNERCEAWFSGRKTRLRTRECTARTHAHAHRPRELARASTAVRLPRVRALRHGACVPWVCQSAIGAAWLNCFT